ncbi:MAG: adenylate kinase [Pirellulales bacterium]|nr:adenylate kinase [Pirellulales bacterium]
MQIVFLGPPGAGKGTQSARLIKYLSIPHLSTGEMLRKAISEGQEIGEYVRGFLEHGQLVPDPVILQLVGERLEQPDCSAGCLFDGFPRTLKQAQALDEFLQERGTPLHVVLELKVDPEALVARLLGRGRPDDQPEIVLKRFRSYEEQTRPVADYYERLGLLRSIDAMGTPDEVFARIQKAVDEAAQQAAKNSTQVRSNRS